MPTTRAATPIIRPDLSIPELRAMQHQLLKAYLNVIDKLDADEVGLLHERHAV